MASIDALHRFIQSRPHLVWYVKDLRNLSVDSAIEHTLNYGDWRDCQELIHILGVERTAEVFRGKAASKRTNYRPEIKNFFQLYFDRHAA